MHRHLLKSYKSTGSKRTLNHAWTNMTYKVTMLVRPVNKSSVLTTEEIEESFQEMIETHGVKTLCHEVSMGYVETESYQIERID
jgi:hypothetical protein